MRRTPDPTRWTTPRSERGASLTEFAIAFPVLMLFMLVIVDFGLNFADRVQTTHAAREAARQAMVNRVGTVTGCDLTPAGTLDSSTQALFCLTKARTQMDPVDVRVRVFYMGPNGKLTTNIANPSNSVAVCVMTRMHSVTGVLAAVLNDKVNTSRSVIKTAKPANNAYVQPGSEQPFAGHSWGWCQADDPVGTE